MSPEINSKALSLMSILKKKGFKRRRKRISSISDQARWTSFRTTLSMEALEELCCCIRGETQTKSLALTILWLSKVNLVVLEILKALVDRHIFLETIMLLDGTPIVSCTVMDARPHKELSGKDISKKELTWIRKTSKSINLKTKLLR